MPHKSISTINETLGPFSVDSPVAPENSDPHYVCVHTQQARSHIDLHIVQMSVRVCICSRNGIFLDCLKK